MTKEIGSSLIFYRKNKSKHEAIMSDVVFKASNVNELYRKAKILAKKESKKLSSTYIGIYDVYDVKKPTMPGGILGKSSFWSYKTIIKARQLLKHNINYSLRKEGVLVSAVYYVKSDLPSETRSVIVDISYDKRLKKLHHFLTSEVQLNRLRQMLAGKKSDFFQGEIVFLGFSGVRRMTGRVRFNQPYLRSIRRFRSLKLINKLVHPPTFYKNRFYKP